MNVSGMVTILRIVEIMTMELAYSLVTPYRMGSTDENTAAGSAEVTTTTVLLSPVRPKRVAPTYPKRNPPTMRIHIPTKMCRLKRIFVVDREAPRTSAASGDVALPPNSHVASIGSGIVMEKTLMIILRNMVQRMGDLMIERNDWALSPPVIISIPNV